MSRCFFHKTQWFYQVVNNIFSSACYALEWFLLVSCGRFQGESRIQPRHRQGFTIVLGCLKLLKKDIELEEIANNRKYNGMHKLL